MPVFDPVLEEQKSVSSSVVAKEKPVSCPVFEDEKPVLSPVLDDEKPEEENISIKRRQNRLKVNANGSYWSRLPVNRPVNRGSFRFSGSL